MTTYSITGLEIQFSELDTVRLADATMALTLAESADTFSYLISEENPGDLPSVVLGDTVENVDIGEFTSLTGGFSLGQTDSGLGSHVILGYGTETPSGDSLFLFNIGGDPLPDFFSGDDAFDFFFFDTASGPVTDGLFAEGVDIPLSDFLNTALATDDGGEIFEGTRGDDFQIGTDNGDALSGAAGDDEFNGNGGDDSLLGGIGKDTLDGGDGNDNIAGGPGGDEINGGEGPDNLSGGLGKDMVNGGGGNDNMGGGSGADTMDGGAGNDVMGGGFGADAMDGGDGNDVMNGGAGTDVMNGSAGNDTMGGGLGDDEINGGLGDDALGGGAGKDTITGGEGNDAIGGGGGDDVIAGNDGDDFLAGGGRNDIIEGDDGNDSINGGRGNDTMTGSDGNDLFIFNNFRDGDEDVITDFNNGQDLIQMRGVTGDPDTDDQSRLDALNITDVEGGALLSFNGNSILLEDVDVADLGVEDFIFV